MSQAPHATQALHVVGTLIGVGIATACGSESPTPVAGDYAANLDALTREVARQQNVQRVYTDYRVSDGQVILANGKLIRLIDIPAEPCGQTELSCDVSESEARSVGSAATVVELGWLEARARDQGQRGTCAAFALNAAVELLAHRAGVEVDLSEQHTYWLGHSLSERWDVEGLAPALVVSRLVDTEEPLVREERWPYNVDSLDCTRYGRLHPGATCSPTIAQGAGSEGRLQAPETVGHPAVRVSAYERLPASLGRLKLALWSGHPVLLSIDATLDFSAATDYAGVVDFNIAQSTCEGVCGHAILAVGFADDPRISGGGYVIVRNSWDASWGDAGLAYLTYRFLESAFLNAVAIESVDLTPLAGDEP